MDIKQLASNELGIDISKLQIGKSWRGMYYDDGTQDEYHQYYAPDGRWILITIYAGGEVRSGFVHDTE